MQGSNGDTDIENRHVHGGGGEGGGGTSGESSMEAYTLPFVKETASENLLYGSGKTNQGSVTT